MNIVIWALLFYDRISRPLLTIRINQMREMPFILLSTKVAADVRFKFYYPSQWLDVCVSRAPRGSLSTPSHNLDWGAD